MTPLQKKALDFIRTSIEANGYSPSYQEIAAALGLRSKAGVFRIVHALIRLGEVNYMKDRKRSLRLGPDPYLSEDLLRLAQLVMSDWSGARVLAQRVIAAKEGAP